MIAHDYIHIPEWISLCFIVGCLLGGVVFSLWISKKEEQKHTSRDEE
jgi:tellurite resistance protein TerC